MKHSYLILLAADSYGLFVSPS